MLADHDDVAMEERSVMSAAGGAAMRARSHERLPRSFVAGNGQGAGFPGSSRCRGIPTGVSQDHGGVTPR
jgi:hypothetical protein